MSIAIYNPDIPQPTDDLSLSQGDILRNFQSLNTLYGVDHVPLTNRSQDQGSHNHVTFVRQDSAPSTDEHRPKMYALRPDSNFRSLQYSRLGDDAYPSPVSPIQAASPFSLAANSNTNVLDLSDIDKFAARVTAWGIAPNASAGSKSALRAAYIARDGSERITKIATPTEGVGIGITLTSNNRVRISAGGQALNNIRWTLEFIRIG